MIVAGTGHRPKYMPGKYDEKHPWQINLKNRIGSQLIQLSPELVISGGALGFDMFLAEIAIKLNIPYDLYLPFKDAGNNWPSQTSKDRLESLKTKARRVVFTSWDYDRSCFHIRDEQMVMEADTMLACWNPTFQSGGTYYTVKFAENEEKLIINLWK